MEILKENYKKLGNTYILQTLKANDEQGMMYRLILYYAETKKQIKMFQYRNQKIANKKYMELCQMYDRKENKVCIQNNYDDMDMKKTQAIKLEVDFHIELPKPYNFYRKHDILWEQSSFSPKTKFKQNIAAIQLLQILEMEERYATPQEQEILAKYVGWGGLADAFDARKTAWKNEYEKLKNLLSEQEYMAARESVLTAYYTTPCIIQFIYRVLEKFGFTTGNILEPAMGIGNFFSVLPKSMQKSALYGVELDNVTGRIARKLYPNANIQICGFENSDFPEQFFDVVLGNVPFGEYKVIDAAYQKHRFLIHDYFFAKALDKVRSGGIIIFITSRGTMDKQNTAVREYIAARAELLGAVRLPNTIFQSNANTDVTTDIIFLKKRSFITNQMPDWIGLSKTTNGIDVNTYFVNHPEMILGTMEMVSGPYGMRATCSPNPNVNLEDALAGVMQYINGHIENPVIDEDFQEQEAEYIPANPDVKNFSFAFVKDKNQEEAVYFREGSRMYPLQVSKTTEERVRGMIVLRDCVYSLIDSQMLDEPEEQIMQHQKELNRLYDAYVKKYGLITSAGNRRAFDKDSGYAVLSALEILDDEGKFEKKADIFYKRTIHPVKAITHTETSQEALLISMNEKAKIDFAYMQQLTGKSEEILISELNGLIFCNPISETWERADEYLSGNVVEKLTIAKKFAETNQCYETNVSALEKVQPTKLEASDIEVRLGATWIEPKYIEDFLRDVFKTPYNLQRSIKVSYQSMTGQWHISEKKMDRDNVIANQTFGTERLNGYELLEKCLNLRDAKIYDVIIDVDGKEKRIFNKEQTLLANTKQETIKEAFRNWIFQEQSRRNALCEKYNAIFNTRRPRVFDGSHLKFHHMSADIVLRTHQKNAVARILYGGNTLLAHCVGAGKTYEMVAAAMELKYLGLCHKPMFVVPNHLTEQWASEFVRLYPGAKILAARKKDFETKNRKRFCSRIATGDYDAIIIGHTQFEKIPISLERQKQIIQNQVDVLNATIRSSGESSNSFTVRQLEKSKKILLNRLEQLNDSSKKDDAITFEQLGVDQLFVDESHYYKNLFTYTKLTNIAGIAHTEAKKSSDMFAKCQYINEITGGRGITFATGTPLSNSMTELYTNMRYLQHDTLQELGLGHFDSWAASFGETQTAVELTPEGNGYQIKTRFARFYNLPELITLFKECADIQTETMLELPRPSVKYTNVLVKPSAIQKDLLAEFADRADEIRNGKVDPKDDNLLKITNDGRKLALDQRLIDASYPEEENSKVSLCARNIFGIWEKTKEQKGTQLVFSDIGTPKKDGGYTVYDDILEQLHDYGVPKNEIAFIHDANTDAKKAALFAKVRNGSVRVLIGSTAKMGAGTNVQNKLVALHHLDVPWRPSDIAQREGRILRQGNENERVEIFRYITENTFDSYSWQVIENKQRFISQVMTDKSPVRSAEDIDEVTLTYAEVKALATGNPLIKEKMDLDVQVSRLKLLKNSYDNQRYRLEDNIFVKYPERIDYLKGIIEKYKTDMQTYTSYLSDIKKNTTQQDMFCIQLGKKMFTNRKEAGMVINQYFEILQKRGDDLQIPKVIGAFMGFPLLIGKQYYTKTILLQGAHTYHVEVKESPSRNMVRLSNCLEQIQTDLTGAKETLHDCLERLENMKQELQKPFTKEKELQEKQARLAKVNAMLNITDGNKEAVLV